MLIHADELEPVVRKINLLNLIAYELVFTNHQFSVTIRSIMYKVCLVFIVSFTIKFVVFDSQVILFLKAQVSDNEYCMYSLLTRGFSLVSSSIQFMCNFFVVADDVNEDILNVSITYFDIVDLCQSLIQ